MPTFLREQIRLASGGGISRFVRKMSRFRLDSCYSRGTLRFLLHGILDGSSAWEIRHAMEGADANVVILDFSEIRSFFEFGAAVLAAGLRAADRSRIRFANVAPPLKEALVSFGVAFEAEAPRTVAEAKPA